MIVGRGYTETPVGAVSDVFIIGGQSNATGQGLNLQAYSHPTLKAMLFGNNYTWQDLTDPTDSNIGQIDVVSEDTIYNGSCWPLLATHYLSSRNLSCAFVPCALAGTSISQWQPGVNHQDRSTLYGSMIHRASITGARCVLWWQGERDARIGTSYATYKANLKTLADAIYADLHVKLMPVKLQNCTALNAASLLVIQNAIADSWGTGNILTGPDLSDITADDGLHLLTDAHLQVAADRWWTALRNAFGWTQ